MLSGLKEGCSKTDRHPGGDRSSPPNQFLLSFSKKHRIRFVPTPRHYNPFLVRRILKTVGGVDGEVRDLFFSATFEDRHDDAGETAGPGIPAPNQRPCSGFTQKPQWWNLPRYSARENKLTTMCRNTSNSE
jgi:hypothetical protein